MTVLRSHEVVGRGFQHKFGDAPTATRTFSVTLDNPNTPTQEILDFIGIKHGAYHPEYTYLRCVDGSLTENSPDAFHATVAYTYELPPLGGNPEYSENPLARPDVWSFSTGGAQVPALTYYDEDLEGNDVLTPLVNGAGDYFEGLTTEEPEVRASISGNRPFFPLSVATAVTNSVNSGSYLGGAAFTWKCSGISAQQNSEVVNGVEVNYWSISVELTYRASGWPLQLPNVGWNYVDVTGKHACYVLDQWNVKVAASNPQPLTENGYLKYPADGVGAPDILVRRVNRKADFALFFGTPPSTMG